MCAGSFAGAVHMTHRGVDKVVHKVVDSVGRLVGFWVFLGLSG
jgi:hypothetical protein